MKQHVRLKESDKMALILAIDTSAKPVSCALAEDGRVLASFYVNTGLTHSQTLMPMIEDMLHVTGYRVSDLTALAVNAGPGSCTGVRIGVSAVKGLAFTGDLPCVSVSTLESMAENTAATPNTVICCLMDARCQQVYGALFEKDTTGQLRRLMEDEALTVQEMGEKLSSLSAPVLLVGDGSEMCYRVWKDSIPNVSLAPASVRYQNAASTAIVAGRYWEMGTTVTAEELQPVYLRLPQAERELNARMNK